MKLKELEKKWENYWYHYKWETWIGIFLVLFVGLFIRDQLSKEKFDMNVVIVSEELVIQEDLDLLAQRLEQYVPDYDGDGVANVNVVDYAIPSVITSEEERDQLSAGTTRFQVSMSDGENFLFIFDDANYEGFEAQQIATNLDGVSSEYVEESVKVMLDDTGLLKDCITMEDRGMFLILRSTDGLMHGTDSKQEKVQNNFEHAKEVITNFLTDKNLHGN